MFRVVPPPIIKSVNNCTYSIWYLLYRYCYLPLSWNSWNAVAVSTVVCAPDDGWRYHPKHVEQFPDKINCVTLHLVRYILEYRICIPHCATITRICCNINQSSNFKTRCIENTVSGFVAQLRGILRS